VFAQRIIVRALLAEVAQASLAEGLFVMPFGASFVDALDPQGSASFPACAEVEILAGESRAARVERVLAQRGFQPCLHAAGLWRLEGLPAFVRVSTAACTVAPFAIAGDPLFERGRLVDSPLEQTWRMPAAEDVFAALLARQGALMLSGRRDPTLDVLRELCAELSGLRADDVVLRLGELGLSRLAAVVLCDAPSAVSQAVVQQLALDGVTGFACEVSCRPMLDARVRGLATYLLAPSMAAALRALGARARVAAKTRGLFTPFGASGH
jgi:hypothetical protein